MISMHELSAPWLGADWGSVPAWAAAGSLAVAATSYLRGQSEKKREHASKVGAWIIKATEDGIEKYYVTTCNTGSSPVYEVHVRASGSKELLSRISELPAGGSVRAEVKKNETSWHPAQKVRPMSVRLDSNGIVMATVMMEKPAVYLEFRDALGREWRNDEDGKITRRKTERFEVLEYSVDGKKGEE
ncbi:hypothetical protein OHA59_30345 [Streptomyces sp. NBC_01589]|uniref:hypothetical protein n=1 Tax=Streptomyces sp. NBC_01589 TaxID=2975886 RepID=UPI0038631F27